MMLAGMVILFVGQSLMPLYVGIALIGFGNLWDVLPEGRR